MITIDLISESSPLKKTGSKLTIYNLNNIESIVQTPSEYTVINFKSGVYFYVLTKEWNDLVEKGEL